mgnify:CR=1 FL=1|tara:strand:+ start:56 stop:592 length:537 start_codon:yes stop_codon:yes gene_type:complete
MMIITCNNCNKNFDVDSGLIPENGRLLQCNSCNYKWFFKKKISNKPVSSAKINKLTEEQEPLNVEIKVSETERTETIKLLDETAKDNPVIEKISINDNTKKKQIKKETLEPKVEKSKNKKGYSMLGLTFVFIVSFIALIIILDTFQNPIAKIIPNIEHLLYNLYETVNDIILFFSDLM